MSNYNSLKTTIDANIKQNGRQEITGQILNSVLNQMVTDLGAGYQFKGVATPTNPGSAQTPDYKCFYVATTPGTYTNLGGLVVADGEVAILKYDTSWTKEVTGAATAYQVSQLSQQVIYDVSENNDGATFASLSALLSSENLSTLIPIAVRCGGMSIRFVQTSDNKYVQYFLKKNEWTTDVIYWEKINYGQKIIENFGGEINMVFPQEREVGYIDNYGTIHTIQDYHYAYIPIHKADSFTIQVIGLTDGYILNVTDSNKQFLRNLVTWYEHENYTFDSIQDSDYYICVSIRDDQISKCVFNIVYNGEVNVLHDEVDVLKEGMVLCKDSLYEHDEVQMAKDVLDYREGVYYNINGEEIVESNYVTCFEDISKVDKLIIDFNQIDIDSAIINIFDEHKQFIKNIMYWGDDDTVLLKKDFPFNAKYINISWKLVDLNKVAIRKIFFGDDKSVESLDIDVNGGGRYTAIKDCYSGDGFVDKAGNITVHSPWVYSIVKIKNAQKIIIYGSDVTAESVIINYMDENKNHISNVVEWATITNLTITNIPQEAYYLCVSYRKEDQDKIFVNADIEGLLSKEISVVNNLLGGTEKEVLGASQGKVISDLMTKYDSAFAYSRNPYKFIKGLFLDAGRKYYSPNNIKTLIDNAYNAGLNTFVLYFSDVNGFRFGLDDMNISANGRVYDLSIILGDGHAPTDGTNKWLTESEMNDIISYTYSKGLDFIPAFDMPGHSILISDAYGLYVTSEAGREYYLAILKKYVTYFQSKGCTYFNICGDESQLPMSVYAPFMERALRVITSSGLVPLIYNDEICKDGYANPYLNTGTVVIGWNQLIPNGHVSYQIIKKSGYKMINSHSTNFYWTLGYSTTTEELINKIRNADIFAMADGSRDTDIVGVIYHIWSDQADLDGPDEGDNVVAQTAPCIAAFGANVNEALPNDAIIIPSVDGTKYKMTVGQGGNITITAL